MDDFWIIVKGWEVWVQVGVLFGIALFTTLIICQGLQTIRVLLRGYPPPEPIESRIQDCSNGNNLTGKCLKPGGCKTIDECHNMVAKYNGNSMRLNLHGEKQ